MGGRVAEELMFHQMTTGASNDIQLATDLARKMVCDWGMSDKLGPLHFGKREGEVFLGRDFGDVGKDYSEETAVEIDGEVRMIVTANYDRAKKVVIENLDKLKAARRGAARVRDPRRRRDRHDLRGPALERKPPTVPRIVRAAPAEGRREAGASQHLRAAAPGPDKA